MCFGVGRAHCFESRRSEHLRGKHVTENVWQSKFSAALTCLHFRRAGGLRKSAAILRRIGTVPVRFRATITFPKFPWRALSRLRLATGAGRCRPALTCNVRAVTCNLRATYVQRTCTYVQLTCNLRATYVHLRDTELAQKCVTQTCAHTGGSTQPCA